MSLPSRLQLRIVRDLLFTWVLPSRVDSLEKLFHVVSPQKNGERDLKPESLIKHFEAALQEI